MSDMHPLEILSRAYDVGDGIQRVTRKSVDSFDLQIV